ncbi:junctional adhesion molecule-like isoform X2 [Erpetoichthys calabaricus]|uniref:junctional adhesion molecule-like isoform X2 n=1 Tax=Erpetoichthys calabaricus TaxID=27687 RepID=UPI00109FD7AC|nr:junctional adhesion molecule-like isoform X2 [Erpetoichthys calabaricus]
MMHSLTLQVILATFSPLLAFEMTCQPVFLQTEVGSSVSITCSWESQRKSAERKIIWTKDDIFLESQPPLEHQSNQTVTDRFQFNYQNMDNRNVSLNIKNLQKSDAGTYECTVIIGEAYREMKINLQVRDQDEKFGKNVEESDPINKSDIILKDMPRQQGLALIIVGVVIGLLSVVILIAAVIVWKNMLGCSHIETNKEVPYMSDRLDSNSSTGSRSSDSVLIKRSSDCDVTEIV